MCNSMSRAWRSIPLLGLLIFLVPYLALGQDAPAALTAAADTTTTTTATAAAAQPDFCTNIDLNFFPVVGGTDYAALNSPSGWTPTVQRDVGNTWNGTLDTIVIYNGPGTAVKIHVSAQHFLTMHRAWVAEGCLYNIPASTPRTPSVAHRHLLQGRFSAAPAPAAPVATPVAAASDAGTMTEADAAAAFAAGAAERAAAREAAAATREAARAAAALAASAPPVSVAAAGASRPAGQVVTRTAPVEFSYSINGSTPVVVPSLTQAGRQEPVAAIEPDLSNMKDGYYCITIKASMAAESGLAVNSVTGRSLAVPLAPIVNTKDICFQLVSAPPSATVALRTCGNSVGLLLSDIQPLAVPATHKGGWLLTRPIVRVTGNLISTTNDLSSVGTAQAVPVSTNTAFDRYIEVPAIGDPTVVNGQDGSTGALLAAIPASQWFAEGWWNFTVTLALAGETPLLVPLPNPAPFPTSANTQGTNMTNRTMYMPATLLSQAIGVQKGKKTLYLRRLQVPTAVQAGHLLNFTFLYSGAPGATTCALDGVPVTNNPTKDACISPLSIKAPADLSKPHVLNVTFTDACGNSRTDVYKLTAQGVETQSKVDDPMTMNGLSAVNVGLGSSNASTARVFSAAGRAVPLGGVVVAAAAGAAAAWSLW